MTQLELSYDDCPELPPLPGTERTEPELDATGRQCLAFIDRNLVDQPAANDVVHAEQAGDSAGNSQTDGSRLTTPRLALLRTSDGAQSELCTLLADAGIEVFPLDVADGQPAFVLPDEYDLALIDFTDAEWAKRRVQSWQRHPQAAGRAILAHGYATASERCQLLEAGAADVLDTRLDPRELVLRCLHTIDRQRAQEARLERLVREKNLTAYPSAQITGVGNTLFATAQRGHISLVVAVLCLTEAATTRVPDVAQMIRCCQHNLRDTDVFAQTAENEFVAVVTNATRHNITGIFERLARHVNIDLGLEPDIQALKIGMTHDLGVSFESMLQRARKAMHSATRSQQLLVLG